jgi:hypothetical protein
VTLKLFDSRAVDLVQDGLYHADVSVDNLQSQGVCRSLKGTAEWTTYCAFLPGPRCCVDIERLTFSQGAGYP